MTVNSIIDIILHFYEVHVHVHRKNVVQRIYFLLIYDSSEITQIQCAKQRYTHFKSKIWLVQYSVAIYSTLCPEKRCHFIFACNSAKC